jgi:hypothetical protein
LRALIPRSSASRCAGFFTSALELALPLAAVLCGVPLWRALDFVFGRTFFPLRRFSHGTSVIGRGEKPPAERARATPDGQKESLALYKIELLPYHSIVQRIMKFQQLFSDQKCKLNGRKVFVGFTCIFWFIPANLYFLTLS